MFHWLNQNAGAVQAMAAVAVAILTGVLVWVTKIYTRLTKEALDVSRWQFEKQWKPDLQIVALTDKTEHPRLKMVNMAYPSVLVTDLNLQFGTGSSARLKTHGFINPVASYGVEEQEIGNFIINSANELFGKDVPTDEERDWYEKVSISVDYKCAGKARTSPCVRCSITIRKGAIAGMSRDS